MLKKPIFKPHFHVETIEPSSVYLLSEHEHHILSGRLYPLLAPLLDGRHDLDEIVEQLAPEVSMLGIYSALTRLESQGYIVEADPIASWSQAAFWSSLGIDPVTAFRKLETARVSVRSFGNVDSKAVIAALKSLKIAVDEDADPAQTDLTIVLTDDYLQLGLSEFNQAANHHQKPWLLVKPVGTKIWLGPIFVPAQTGCWECLAQRLRGNRTVESSIRQQKGTPAASISTPPAALPVSLQMAIDWAAMETAKQLVLETPSQLVDQILTFDTTQISIERHTLVKRPQCPACGTPGLEQKQQPIALKSQPKRFSTDGGHRSFTPAETLQKYTHHLSPISGVVSNLVKLNSNSNFIYVYTANYLDLCNKRNSAELRLGSTTRTAGKGKSDSQSQASCICEALERYSGSFTGNEDRIAGTYTQLAPVAIHPNDCALYSLAQYQHRAEWNPMHGSFAWVAQMFDVDREIDWTPVWSLTEQKFKYLPTAYCYYSYPQIDGHNFCMGDSNGNAAGHSLEEAIVQGFMELVERDCVALWWYNRIPRPAVDLDSFDEPYVQTLRDYYRTQNYEFWVLDLTNDFQIPSFAAVVRRDDPTSEAIALGFGTHFDPKIAILRAATEVNQFMAMLERHTIDPDLDFSNPDLEYWYRAATLANQPYLTPDCSVQPKVYTDYPNYDSNDLKEDVLNCIEIATNLGLETLVLDQTRPDIGLNVVKVIVPGMRHFWSRFAPGRLYDVPVQMGWLQEPLTEEQLNPIPMFF